MKRCEKVLYANDFAANDDTLRVHFIGHPSYEGKSDAFLIEYGKELYLVDGGFSTVTDTRAYLHALRESLLCDHPELVEDTSCKLRLHWLLSHFHNDHSAAVIGQLIPDPFFEFGDLWLPPDATIHPDYTCPGFDGDENMRPKLAAALAALSEPNYTIHNLSFGTTPQTVLSTRTEGGHELEITILPPTRDYGEEQYMKYYTEHYSKGEKNRQSNPLSAVNNSCCWVLVRFGSRRFLFTGDTMKRSADLHDEGLDHMLEAYGGLIGKVDVVKYPHHGFVRENALPYMLGLGAQYMMVTYQQSNIPDLLAEKYPDSTARVINVGDDTAVFTCGFDAQTGEELPLTCQIIPQ